MNPDLRGMRVLVTGAAGFAGGHLTRALLDSGAEVTALRHRRDLPRELTGRMLPGDAGALREAVAECDAICHAAAFVPPALEDPSFASECFETNAAFTLKLAQAAAQNPKLKFIYYSLGQGYQVPAGRAATETDLLYPTRSCFYLGSKMLGELYVESLRREHALPWYSFRIASMYGTGMRSSSVVAIFMDRARTNQALEVHHSGMPACDFVHVSGVTSVVLNALVTDAEPGIYNVGSGRAVSLLELARTVVEVFGSSSKIEIQPARGNPPASFAPLDSRKAAAAFGYHPLPLRAGLEKEKQTAAVTA